MGKVGREKRFEAILAEAEAAGKAAAEACVPTPMVVCEHANMLDDNSPVKKSWFVSEGVCGFAWVNVKPGTSAFCRYLKKTGRVTYKSYYGGYDLWVSGYGQSMARKEAYAHAYAEVLNKYADELKVKCYAMSRLD